MLQIDIYVLTITTVTTMSIVDEKEMCSVQWLKKTRFDSTIMYLLQGSRMEREDTCSKSAKGRAAIDDFVLHSA
jgi:hypothetical protein